MQQFIAEQEVVVGTDRDALEALSAEKHQKYLIYHRLKYDRCREKVIAKRRANYQPTERSVGLESRRIH